MFIKNKYRAEREKKMILIIRWIDKEYGEMDNDTIFYYWIDLSYNVINHKENKLNNW